MKTERTFVPSDRFFKFKIFIPAVSLDGFANEHQTGLSRHFVLHKPSDVLFNLLGYSVKTVDTFVHYSRIAAFGFFGKKTLIQKVF